MTDNPRTLQFDVTEWRDLCIHAAHRIAKDLERFDQPTAVDVFGTCTALDRLKLFLTGWSRAGIVAAPPADIANWQESTAQAKGEEVAYSVANGGFVAEQPPAPRKRGRPRKEVQPDVPQ